MVPRYPDPARSRHQMQGRSMRAHRAQAWHTPYIYKNWIPGQNWGWSWICRMCGTSGTTTHMSRKYARGSWGLHVRNGQCVEKPDEST